MCGSGSNDKVALESFGEFMRCDWAYPAKTVFVCLARDIASCFKEVMDYVGRLAHFASLEVSSLL